MPCQNSEHKIVVFPVKLKHCTEFGSNVKCLTIHVLEFTCGYLMKPQCGLAVSDCNMPLRLRPYPEMFLIYAAA